MADRAPPPMQADLSDRKAAESLACCLARILERILESVAREHAETRRALDPARMDVDGERRCSTFRKHLEMGNHGAA